MIMRGGGGEGERGGRERGGRERERETAPPAPLPCFFGCNIFKVLFEVHVNDVNYVVFCEVDTFHFILMKDCLVR